TAEAKAIELLREYFFMLPALRMDQPIFADNRAVSVMLRLAQFKLISNKETPEDLAKCVDALLREISEEPNVELRRANESIAFSSILTTIGIASWVPNWVELLQRFRALAESDS